MRRIVIATMLALAAWTSASALAQGPLPDTLRSSSLTRAQEDELNRRLTQLQSRFGALATETNLREAAVRNVAIEIFGADPSLNFETYVALIDNGARELRTYLTDARARSDPDPTAAAIRQRAIAAAEDGRLREARGLYDQLIAANRSARQRARDTEDLADAADMAEAARLAYVAADYLDAARRYGEAAELAPEEARERWLYTMGRGYSLYQAGYYFSAPEQLHRAVGAYQVALTLRPREVDASDWADTQQSLAGPLIHLGWRGEFAALAHATEAIEAALTVRTREVDPRKWGALQNNLSIPLRMLGERGSPGALERAVRALDAALEVQTRMSNPVEWARTRTNHGIVFRILSERGAPGGPELDWAIAAFEDALTVWQRDVDPENWALIQMDLGMVYEAQGELGELGALERAVAAYEGALTIKTREAEPPAWAEIQTNLGNALSAQGRLGSPGALVRAVAAYEAALTVQTREADPFGWSNTMYNLAVTYSAMRRVRDARETAQAALDVFQQIGNAYGTDQARAFIAALPAN